MTRNQAAKFLQLYGGLTSLSSNVSKNAKTTIAWKKVAVHQEQLLLRRGEFVDPQSGNSRGEIMIASLDWFSNTDACQETLSKYGFHSLVRHVEVSHHRDPIISGSATDHKTRYRIVRTRAELREVEKQLSTARECAMDTETSGKDPRKAALYGVSLSFEPEVAFYLPVIDSHLDGITPEDVLGVLRAGFKQDIKVIGHNLKYDLLMLLRNGVEISCPHFDTMLAASECFGDLEFRNLGFMSKRFLGKEIKRYRDLVSGDETFLDVPLGELVEHACSDADITFQLYQKLRKELGKRKVLEGFLSDRMTFMAELLKREHKGVSLNEKAVRKRLQYLVKEEEKLTAGIRAQFGESIDLGSLKSIREHLIIVEQLRDAVGMRTLTPTFLEDLALRQPMVLQIVKCRRISQQMKELHDILAANIGGKVFPLFSQMKPAGLVFTSDRPKLDEAMLAGAVKDKVLLNAWLDVKNSLARLEQLSKDKVLQADLNAGSADQFVPGNIIPDGLNHGEVLLSLVTSSSDSSLSKQLLLPRAIEMTLRSGVEERYPGIFRWVSGFKKEVALNGFAEYKGKRRYLDGVQSADLNRKNRALVAGVRWALRYYV